MREGFLPCSYGVGWTQNTQDWTGEIDNGFLVAFAQSTGEEDAAHHTEPYRGCTWDHNEQAGAVGGRLIVARG